MFASRSLSRPFASRAFSTSARANSKVAVLGAAGGIGQPLSLLLKFEPSISHLSLYDIVNTPGVAADIGHIDTPAKVTGHVGDADLKAAVENAEVVVIPAGVPRKPGMTRDDLFNTNATIVAKLAEGVAKWSPKAAVLVIANPVNSTVPIVAEVFKKYGVYDERKIFGVTTLDIVRANSFVKELKNAWNDKRDVKVVGGHSGVTIIPLLSQTGYDFSPEEVEKLTHRIQFGGDEVVKAKAGTGSATLSMAYAGARFTVNVLKALKGVPHIQDIGFVYHGAAKPKIDVAHPSYFASEIKLGTEGVKEILPVGTLNDFEKTKLAAAIPELEGNIAKGVEFVQKYFAK